MIGLEDQRHGEETDMSQRSKSVRIVIMGAGVVLALVLGLWMWQGVITFRERDKLRGTFEGLEHELSKLERVEQQAADLKRISEEKQEDLDRFREMVPVTFSLDSFREEFTAWAEGSGVRVVEFDFGLEQSEPDNILERIPAKITVEGDDAALAGLFQRRRELPRLARWITAGPPPDRVLVIEIFRAKSSPASDPPEFVCPVHVSRVWMWPFRQKIARDHAKLRQLCDEIEPRRGLQKQLRRLEQENNDIEHLIHLITKLRKEEGVILPGTSPDPSE
jgi:Tfp pilus assembly protein PilO